MTRSYRDAINALNSLQSNAAVIAEIRQNWKKNAHRVIPETCEYLKRAGYLPEDLDRLNIIHITGTKGKGSTSAFCDSILRQLRPSAKIGLYTSPHLVAVRERIRINGKPISEESFARYFFDVWDRYAMNDQRADIVNSPLRPAYARFLTIMAFHVFVKEEVDVTVLEVGIGGTYDATNVIVRPLATGVTSLGLDHIDILGKTLGEIAHQKGGIFKRGVPAISVAQPPEARDMLKARAAELGASSFAIIENDSTLKSITLGLAGRHQYINASLSVALVDSFLSSPKRPKVFDGAVTHKNDSLSHPVKCGLELAHWPGRCQVIRDPSSKREKVTWYLDGAHTEESMLTCGQWFAHETLGLQGLPRREQEAQNILLFNCTSDRKGQDLFKALLSATEIEGLHSQPFAHVILCPNVLKLGSVEGTDLDNKTVDVQAIASLKFQQDLATAWKEITQSNAKANAIPASIHILPSIQDSVELISSLSSASTTSVLVTGSLHLVGGVMDVAKLPFE